MAAMAMALVVALAMATLQTARRRRPYRIPNPRRDSHALQLHGALAAAARHPLRLAGRGHHFPHHADHVGRAGPAGRHAAAAVDRKSTRLNSSHLVISYAVFCLKKTTH